MLANLQHLRAFAAINVVIFHIIVSATGYQQSLPWFNLLKDWGQNGVDIFFVISGFIMLHTQLQQPKTALAFFRQRLIRIVPLYWLLTLLVVLLLWLFPALFRQLNLQANWVLASFFFSAQWLTGLYPVLFVGWTLEWEMLFYLLFGCALALKSGALLLPMLSIVLATFAALTCQWMLLEFIFGMLAAWLFHRARWSVTVGWLFLLSGIVLLGLSLFPTVQALSLHRTLSWGVPAFLLVLGAVTVPALQQAWLSRLGDASYSIYLLQILTIPACYKVSVSLLPQAHPLLLATASLGLTLLLALLCYRWIEQPMLQWLRRRWVH